MTYYSHIKSKIPVNFEGQPVLEKGKKYEIINYIGDGRYLVKSELHVDEDVGGETDNIIISRFDETVEFIVGEY